jgi:hypothetical protein
MTMSDTVDLFSPATRRERVMDWQAPGPVAKAAAAMSGLEAMRAIRDGILPPPPMARLIGFRMAVAEPGRIVMELEPHESLENTIGLLHGATAAALLDTAMGCAVRPCYRRGRCGHAGPEVDLFAAAFGAVREYCGRRQDHQAGPSDQLYRRLRPRRRGPSCGALNRDLFDDR